MRVMIVMRCAWHPQYRGYRWVYRVASWRDPGRLQFSDGMCPSCARRWRAEFWAGRAAAGEAPEAAPPPLIPGWMPRVGIAAALSAAVLLAARPIDTGQVRPLADALPGGASQAQAVHVTTGQAEPAASGAGERPCAAPDAVRPQKTMVRPAAPVQRAAVTRRVPATRPRCVGLAATHPFTPAAGECRAVVARLDPAPAMPGTQAP